MMEMPLPRMEVRVRDEELKKGRSYLGIWGRYIGYALYFGFKVMQRSVTILTYLLMLLIASIIVSGVIYLVTAIYAGGFSSQVSLNLGPESVINGTIESIREAGRHLFEEAHLEWTDLLEVSSFNFSPKPIEYLILPLGGEEDIRLIVGDLIILSLLLAFIYVLNHVTSRKLGSMGEALSAQFFSGRISRWGFFLKSTGVVVLLFLTISYVWSTTALSKIASVSLILLTTMIAVTGSLVALILLIISSLLMGVKSRVNFTFRDLENKILEELRKDRECIELSMDELRALVMELLGGTKVMGKMAKSTVHAMMEDFGMDLYGVRLSDLHGTVLLYGGIRIFLLLYFITFLYFLGLALRPEMSSVMDFRMVFLLGTLGWPFIIGGYKLFIHFLRFVRYPEPVPERSSRIVPIVVFLSILYPIISIIANLFRWAWTSLYVDFLILLLLLQLMWVANRLPVRGPHMEKSHPLFLIFSWSAYALFVVKPIFLLSGYIYDSILRMIGKLPFIRYFEGSETRTAFLVSLSQLTKPLEWELAYMIALSIVMGVVIAFVGRSEGSWWRSPKLNFFLMLVLTLLTYYELDRSWSSTVNYDLWILLDPLFSFGFASISAIVLGYKIRSVYQKMKNMKNSRKQGDYELEQTLAGYVILSFSLYMVSNSMLFQHTMGTMGWFFVAVFLLTGVGIVIVYKALTDEDWWREVGLNQVGYAEREKGDLAYIIAEIYGLILTPVPPMVVLSEEERFTKRLSPECEYY